MDKTFCIFGDSVTQAAYVKTGWVDLFRIYLEEKYRDEFINVFNLGVGGNTSDDILKRFKSESEARMPTVIIFAFGVNDSGYFRTPDKPIVSEERFTKNIESLISQANKLTTNITFVGPVLGDESLLKPYPESTKGKSYEFVRVQAYDRLIKNLAEKNLCQYISLLDKLNFEDFSDGLHPNDKGHLKMFQEIKKYF
jgi:lysophospholipase L1-like esterase